MLLFANALPRRMGELPQFKIFDTVIELVAIAVMDDLRSEKLTTQMLLHDETVLVHVLALRTDKSRVVRLPAQRISFADNPAPVPTFGPIPSPDIRI